VNRKSIVGVGMGAALVVVGGYVALSWIFGQMVHTRFDAWEGELAKQPVPFFRIAKREYERGIFSSVEVVTLAVNRELLKAPRPGGMQPAAAITTSPDTNELLIAVRNVVSHGPLPGLTSVGVARIETTIAWPTQAQAEIDKVFGGHEPLLLTTRLGLSGGLSSHLVSPPVEYQEGSNTAKWQGFEGTLDVSGNLDSIKCQVTAPGLDVHDLDLTAHMEQMSVTCDGRRAFEVLYVGTMNFDVAALQVASKGEPPMTADKMHYAVDVRADGDYMDAIVRVGAGAVNVQQFQAQDLRYDFTVKHVHGPTYAALSRRMQEVQESAAVLDPNASAGMMAAFRELGPELLEHSPEIIVDRIGFTMAEGELGITGTAHVIDFKKEDFAGDAAMNALIGKLEATADVWMAEGLIEKFSTAQAQSTAANGVTREGQPTMQEQIAAIEQQGFITRKDGQLRSRIEFRNGALTANGKPLRPPAR
jgi:uncharacterized protein YdgA (DUF945 family)